MARSSGGPGVLVARAAAWEGWTLTLLILTTVMTNLGQNREALGTVLGLGWAVLFFWARLGVFCVYLVLLCAYWVSCLCL